jgi:bifunctional ADP-heptose synthase (sugar kinase/adenylyltransferase)
MNADRFLAITGRYARLRIGVVGDFFLDRYLHIDPAQDETSIETGLTAYNVVEVRAQPGAAGTILNNLVALGVGEIHAVGFCGDDGEGYELRRALAAPPGVHLEHFLTVTSRRTPVYCKPIGLDPGRPPRELNRLDSKNGTATPDDLQRDLATRVLALADQVDALLLLDQVERPETGVVTRPVREAAHAALARRKGLVTLADSRRGLRDFPPLGFKMNAAELARMTAPPAPSGTSGGRGSVQAAPEPARITGTTSGDLEAVKHLAAQLAGRNGEPVFVTLSERGIVGALPNRYPEHVPAHPIRGPIDIVGAGDAVTANLAAALASGGDLREAMEMAMAAASIVIHQVGTTGTATLSQVAEFLALHDSP